MHYDLPIASNVGEVVDAGVGLRSNRGRTIVETQPITSTTSLGCISCAGCIAVGLGDLCSSSSNTASTVAFVVVFSSGILKPLGRTEADARFDSHAGIISIGGGADCSTDVSR